VAAVPADQEDQVEDPVDLVDDPVAGLCGGAKSAPSVSRRLRASTIRKSTRFEGSFQSGPRLSLAAAPVFAPNTSVPFGRPFSGPGRSRWCPSWLTMLTLVALAVKQSRSAVLSD